MGLPPLAGRTVLVVASEERVERLTTLLRARGANVISFPTVRIVPPGDPGPLDRALARWASYDWVVFTSTNGVDAVARRARALRANLRARAVRIAAVGSATKDAAEAAGMTVHAMPDDFLTDAIGASLGDLSGRRILLPRSNLARRSLAEDLRNRGAEVHEVDAYEGIPASPDVSRLRRTSRIDFILFTSASAARNLVALLPDPDLTRLRTVPAACIGPVTADATREVGFRVATVPAEHTVPGLVQRLEEVNARG